MEITIDPYDSIRVGKNFADRANRIASVVETILKSSVHVVERWGKYYSPVKTGRMRASISEGIILSKLYASVAPTVFYAPYVHRRVPFMFAGAESSRKEINSIVKEEVKKALK